MPSPQFSQSNVEALCNTEVKQPILYVITSLISPIGTLSCSELFVERKLRSTTPTIPSEPGLWRPDFLYLQKVEDQYQICQRLL